MATGIEMMLKAAGVDPKKIIEDFEKLKDGVVKTLKAIESETKVIKETQERIETSQARIEAGHDYNQKLLEEITAWKRQSTQRELAVRSQQLQPPAAQQPPVVPPTMQPENQ